VNGLVVPDPKIRPTVSVEEAGQILGISRGAAYRAARTGELPTLRFGRRLIVPTARLLEMLGGEVIADVCNRR
jgi:excisionase family DNA binding protein